MTAYIAAQFGPGTLAVITIALLAAGMSTLDGLLVALSSIAGHDIVGRFTDDPHKTHRASQVILVLLGVAAFVIALDPPKLLGIFGQIGVYGIVAASALPMVLGIFVERAGARLATACAVVALLSHFGLYGYARYLAAVGETVPFGLLNPATTATCGVLASGLVAIAALAYRPAPAKKLATLV